MVAFDEICGCSYENEYGFCLCVKRKEQARDRCTDCLRGRHLVEIEETQVLKGDKND